MNRDELRQYRREWLLERASILEFEAGLPREEAERRAVSQWHRLTKIAFDLQVSEWA